MAGWESPGPRGVTGVEASTAGGAVVGVAVVGVVVVGVAVGGVVVGVVVGVDGGRPGRTPGA